MDVLALVEWVGEPGAAWGIGLVTGAVFGVAAQRSRFCLRASTVEFARGRLGPRMAIWLLAFSTALFWTQLAELSGLFAASEARIMSVAGSISGAIIGGLLFGAGMVLARGCSGRLLVLASTGNLRSLVSGLVFAVFAQMSLSGFLAPMRSDLAQLWVTPQGRNFDMLDLLGLPQWSGLALGLMIAVIAVALARRNELSGVKLFMASGVGFAVALGWSLTSYLSQISFDPVQIQSATFTGPSADTLMFFLASERLLDFDLGLICGVAAGAFLASIFSGEFKLQGFEGAGPMRRALSGAAMMGFGGMLAGGCAIGAGVTGGSIFVTTAWLALFCMWIGAILTDWLVDQPASVAQQKRAA